MNKQMFLGVAVLVVLIQPMHATVVPRSATIIRGGGIGKCTIEVNVDGSAEVEVSGDTGLLRTLSGQTAVWRRFQCNEPLPRSPRDFRFVGVDGRGNVRLIRDPRGNGGKAVVRIDDRKGGREGYTFDLQWGGSGRGGWSPAPPPPPGRGPGWGESPAARAIRVCQDSVTNRLNRDGYTYVIFQRTVPDNNPGRNDWVTGTVTAKRRYGTEWFSFSCSVDFKNGWVRSVDLQRR